MKFRLLTLTLLLCASWVSAEGWKAGAAKVRITPEQPMWMAGYGSRDHAAEGKVSDLWAKALVLEDSEKHRGVIVTFDLVGIDRGISTRICTALQNKYGLQRSQIALCASHTHCGPAVGRNLAPLHYLVVDPAQRKLIEDYTPWFEQRVVEVVGEAMEKLAPAELSWGSGVATYAVNRRNNSESQVVSLRDSGQLRGPVDHDVPVLAVRNPEGQLSAVLFGYACHATVLSFYQWCADHPGYAQSELEASHPGCVALFWQGCGADQNPLPRRTVELAKHYGQRLAVAVDEVLMTRGMTRVEPRLSTSYHEIELALDKLPTRSEIEANAKSTNKFEVARAKMLLDQLDAGGQLSGVYPYPIGVWSLGNDVRFITLGGEVVVDYAVRLKSELAGAKTWVASYSHDVMAYIPSRRVLQEGGYEGGGAMVYYGLPAVWAPEVEEAIVRDVHAQIGVPR